MNEDLYEIELFDDDAEWMEKRRHSIGSSDCPTIIGANPWQSPVRVWAEKTGQLEPEDLDDVERVRWGNLLEPVVLHEYAERTKRYASHDRRLYLAKTLPFPAHATIDGLTWIEDYVLRWPLEVKCTDHWMANLWELGAPEYVRAQCHHQMLVTGAKRATVACLIGGNQLVWQDIERDEQLIRKIVQRCTAFWELVKDGEMPEVDNKDATAKALAALYPQDNEDVIDLPDEWQGCYDELVHWKEHEKEAKKQAKLIENQFKAELQEATKAVLPSGDGVTWRTGKRGRTFRLAGRK